MTCEEKFANLDNEYNRLSSEFVDIQTEMVIIDERLNKNDEKYKSYNQ